MSTTKKTLRTCNEGHKYYKSCDCSVCPVCEKKNKPIDKMLALLVAPAWRALLNKGINTLHQLSGFSETEIKELHGMEPSTITKLHLALK